MRIPIQEKPYWKKWFAWHPVLVEERCVKMWVWLEYVYRHKSDLYTSYLLMQKDR